MRRGNATAETNKLRLGDTKMQRQRRENLKRNTRKRRIGGGCLVTACFYPLENLVKTMRKTFVMHAEKLTGIICLFTLMTLYRVFRSTLLTRADKFPEVQYPQRFITE